VPGTRRVTCPPDGAGCCGRIFLRIRPPDPEDDC
jgi:hypothetical protein